VLPVFNVFRKDVPETRFGRDEIMANAPDSEEGMFRVPRIV
jgi:aspartyl/glutamyl-tRNA(Asn/Gln) amidotransferase C subunit